MPTSRPAGLPSLTLEPTGFVLTPDGVNIAYYDMGGKGRPLLLAHATGFCAAVFQPLTTAMRSRFHCYAIDLRAHGQSGKPSGRRFEWGGFATDIASFVDQLGLIDPVGFGHSCGGAALLLAEEARPGTFGALHCYEPIVFPSDTPMRPTQSNPLTAIARRRRSSFRSREEALSNFRAKPPFDRFATESLVAYVDNGFSLDHGGGIRLRCDREDEAQMYTMSLTHDAYSGLDRVRCPVTLYCGELTDSIDAATLNMLAGRLESSRVVVLPALGHFGPLENPSMVAASVASGLPANS